MAEMPPLCLDIEGAAASIGMSPTVLRSYIDAGLLPVIKFPGKHQGERSRRVLVAVDDLRAFVEQHRVTEPTR